MAHLKPFRARQAGKTIWTILVICKCLFRLPILSILFSFRIFRQRLDWTYRQSFTNEITKCIIDYFSNVEAVTPRSMAAGSDGDRFVVMQPGRLDPAPSISKDEQIRPVSVGAIWIPDPYRSGKDAGTDVVLHFHGGAYVLLSPRDPNVQWGPSKMGQGLRAKVLCPQYRLASNPGGRFPAALQDALTSYHYLLEIGVPASRIILSGDSAGAHLVISLLRLLSSPETKLPSPAAALLWSPWTNLAVPPQDLKRHPNYRSDYVTPAFLGWGIRCFVPPFLAKTDPYISPMNHPFHTTVPMWVQTGQAELLHDQAVRFVERMRLIPGNRTDLHEVPRAPHDIFAAAGTLGFEAEWEEGLASAMRFMREQGVEIPG